MIKIICVDLDGTLVFNDVSIESAVEFVRSGWLNFFKLCFWSVRYGISYAKYRVAENHKLDPERLAYNLKLVSYLNRKKSNGCSIFLATGSSEIYAKLIAQHLGIFDGVFASSKSVNLVGKEKAEKLVRVFGEKKFTYIGNSLDDIHVWERSAESVIVNPDKGVLSRMEGKEYRLFK